jgi:chitinase
MNAMLPSRWHRSFCLTALLLLVLGVPADAQTVSCTGVPTWNPTTIYNAGDRIVHNGRLYRAEIQIWNTPPDHCPPCGWYTLLGTCGAGGSDTTPPSVPTGLNSPSKTTTSVSLAWNASTDNSGGSGVAGYDVFRNGTIAGSPAATNFTVTGLTANTSYSFTVRARDNAGNASAQSAALSVTTNGGGGTCSTLPGVPTGLNSPSKTDTSVSLAWNASAPGANCTVQYRVFRNGTQITQVATTSTTAQGLAPSTTYSFAVAAINQFGSSAQSSPISVTTNPPPPPGGGLPARLLVGYWHNFNNGSGVIKLRDVSTAWDVVNIAFGEPVAGSTSQIGFTPDTFTSQAEMRSDIQILHGRGKKVLLSIGGANGHVQLRNATERAQFVSSVRSIINTYGLDGIDIDFEGGSVVLNAGDTDFRNPTTPVITNLISAVREIRNAHGPGFVLSMAPETFFVQVGFDAYGPSAGAYLPVIHGLRDILTYIHVQHYNTGSVTALDGRAYSSATADFHVAMAEMLLRGFPIAHNANNVFPALRPDQVAIGLPATPQAAGSGFTTAAVVHRALDYLVKGQSFGGQYVLRNPAGYRAFRGLMTWSINWDRFGGFSFSTPHRSYLNSLPPP